MPYYEGGRAYAPYAAGYFGGGMNMLFTGLLVGSLWTAGGGATAVTVAATVVMAGTAAGTAAAMRAETQVATSVAATVAASSTVVATSEASTSDR